MHDYRLSVRCARDFFGRLALTWKARSGPRTHEPSLTRRGINENICRLHVLVDQLPLVQSAECGCSTNGEAQEPCYFHRPWKEAIKSLTARIFEHERHLPTVLGEGQGPNRPS